MLKPGEDAAVLRPLSDSWRGVAVGCGLCPRYAKLDPYAMAASAIEEAVRNVLSVGGGLEHLALLDNFCAGNPEDPRELGDLVRAVRACEETARALKLPFISGKDSLNNTFETPQERKSVPTTLLVSAVGVLRDIRRVVSLGLKRPGSRLYLLGLTRLELGGSQWLKSRGLLGSRVPRLDLALAGRIHRGLRSALETGKILSCHDLSEGGLGTALAEMVLASDWGARLDLEKVSVDFHEPDPGAVLFSESNSRFLVEATGGKEAGLERLWRGLPFAQVGRVERLPGLSLYQQGHLLSRVSQKDMLRVWGGEHGC